MYVSITGIKLKPSMWAWLSFWPVAVQCKMAADKTRGVLHVEVGQVDGVSHTLTAWESREAMLEFRRCPIHIKAMKSAGKVAESGKIFGYEADTIPTWEEAIQLWRERSTGYASLGSGP